MKFMSHAQASEMSGAEKRTILGALETQADQPWRSHQVMFVNDMNSNEATVKLQRHQRQSYDHLQEYQQGVRRYLPEVQ